MLGAQVLHEVNAIRMSVHTDLRMRKFDRIIFNFPHAGFHGKEDHLPVIKKHRDLLHGFFKSASRMLRPDGEVHVNHKTSHPFCHWKLEELALKNSLVLIECVDFRIADYPGYNNKRGDSFRCDEPFPLGKASTYKFIFSTERRMCETNPLTSIPLNIQHQLIYLDPNFASRPSDVASGNHILPNHNSIRNDWYYNHAVTTFGRPNYDEAHYVREGSRIGIGSERFMAEHPIRPQPMCLNPNFDSLPSGVASGNYILPNHNRIRNDWYHNHAVTNFGRPNYDEAHYVREGSRTGHENFMAEHPIQPQPMLLYPIFASWPSDVASGNHTLPNRNRIRNDLYFNHGVTTFHRPNYDEAP